MGSSIAGAGAGRYDKERSYPVEQNLRQPRPLLEVQMILVRSTSLVSALAVMAGVLGAISVARAIPQASGATTQPRLEIAATAQDGGTVEEGVFCEFKFRVVNRGKADLLINEVKPSCGCTAPKWDRVVKPGAESVIGAQMNTEYLRGAVTKHLMVFSNDPSRPEIELTITAHVHPLVQITPAPAALLTVEDAAVTREFTLERSGGHPMKILEVIPNSPFIKTEATPLPGPGRFKVAITATADAPYGRSTVPVVVRTDLEKGGMLMLTLTVDRGIVTEPPVAFMGLLTEVSPLPMSTTCTVTRQSGPFHVKSVAVDDPKLAVKFDTVRDGAEYRVVVTYAGGWDAGVKRRTLTITTDDPKQPSITVPVQAIVQAKSVPNTPGAGR
jgi:hypothetical protein